MNQTSYRKQTVSFIVEQYHANPEHLWKKYPNYEVFRHDTNQKWFAVIMDVSKNKLGLESDDIVDILVIKADPVMAGNFLNGKNILPGYHMNKTNWITILLDGSVPMETIELLLDTSYELTQKKSSPKKNIVRNTEWIIPANPRYYDIESALRESKDDIFLWKQSNHICVGDKVYLYVAAPISAIMYKCQAVEVDIPYSYEDENLRMNKAMKLKLIERYADAKIKFSVMKENGVGAVRGPRSMPNSLKSQIEKMYNK